MERSSTRESEIKKWSGRDKYGMTGLLNCSLFRGLSKKDFRLLASMSGGVLEKIGRVCGESWRKAHLRKRSYGRYSALSFVSL